MEDKKPCDDIFDGLAELLIKNGEITDNCYRRDRHFGRGVFNVYTRETWSINYGGYVYLLDADDGVVNSIRRVRVEDEESEDE